MISMLTPASPSAPKKRALTPGMALHAGADQRHLADVLVVERLLEADLVLDPLQGGDGCGRVGLGRGEGDVGTPGGRMGGDLHDHVDVDPGVGNGAEDGGGEARLVGASDDGHLRFAAVVSHPADDCLLHVLAFLLDS